MFPQEEFHIVVSVDIDSEFDDKITLRYYTYRGEDGFHFDLDGLDDFKYNAILINVVEAEEADDEDNEVESEDED